LDLKEEKICEKEFSSPDSDWDLTVKREKLPKKVKVSSVNNVPCATEQFSCVFCEKLIRGQSNLSAHVNKFHKNEAIRCQFASCWLVFKSQKSLEEHNAKDHFAAGKHPVECKVCKKWYACKISLSNHTRKKHPEKHEVKNPNNSKTLQAKMRAKLKIEPLSSTLLDCIFCDASFENNKNLYEHTKNNHKEVAVKCQLKQCKLYFKTKLEMEEHFKSAHINECKFCMSTFTTANLLSSHFKKEHPDKKCKFHHCTFYTDLEEELEAHKKEKHSKKGFCKCIYCGSNFVDKQHRGVHIRRLHSHIAIQCDKLNCQHYVKNISELEEHKKEAHVKIEKQKICVICLFCQKEIWDTGCYVGHVKRYHSEEALRCKYKNCFSFFKSEIDLQKHYELKHVGKYECAFCDFVVNRRGYMEFHFEQHHLPWDKKCPHCPKLFGNRRQLKKHVFLIHESKEKCPHCREIGTNLSRHVVTAKCPVCSQPFPCKKLLFAHKLGCKKLLECRECGRKFKIESQLKFHMNKMHKSGQVWKGYECKKCVKYFPAIKFLKNHLLKEHADLLKYKCDLCEEKFLSYSTLKAHKFRTHGIGGFECKLCDKIFVEKSTFLSHMKKKHGKGNQKMIFVDCAVCGKIMQKCSLAEHYRHNH